MLVIRGFEQRVAALYRDGEIPGFVHLSIGQEASAVGACWPLGPADVITSTHRGHGHCLAKGLDAARDVRRADGQGRRARTAGAGARCTSPIRPSGSSARTGSSRRGCRSRSALPPRRSSERDGSVVVAFFGDGAVAQGAFHEAVNLAAVWKLPVVFFCENNGYAEFSPGVDAARGVARTASRGIRRRLRRGRRQRRRRDRIRDARRGRGHPRRTRARHRRGRHPPLARPLRRRPAALPNSRRDGGGRGARPAARTMRACSGRMASVTTPSARWSRRSRTSSTPPSRRPGCSTRPRPPRCPTSSPARDRHGPSRRPPPTTPRSSARWTRSAPRSRSSSPATTACSSRASTSAPAATSSGSRVDSAIASVIASATRRSPRPRSWASVSAPRWRGCAPWSSSCTSTSSVSVSTSCSTRPRRCRS